METVDFLRAIWPATGLYVVARLINGKFRHQVCDSIEEAAAYAQNFDSQGVETYHACAVFRERSVTSEKNGETWHQVRTHKNVRALKCFWMDLDVKPGVETAYQSQEEAVEALAAFLQATNLPMPMVVSSGYGIHIYWILDHEILPETWKPIAEGLKRLAAFHKFKADPACTSDLSRVLRPVGTYNRKDAAHPRAVACVADSGTVAQVSFADAVGDAVTRAGVAVPAPAVRAVESTTEALNQQFQVTRNFPPCSGFKVADRCQQIRVMRDAPTKLSEPLLYASIQLLTHAVEGDELIHTWASGHPNYNRASGYIDGKIAQLRGQKMGPTLCTTFEDRAPGGCDGCPFKGKISSPAQLGTEVKVAPAPVVSFLVGGKEVSVTLPDPPEPFKRCEGGGITIEEEGITHKIYEYDLFPVEIAHDEALGFETMRWRHWLPKEGWKECTLQSSLLARPVDFEAKLRDFSIQPLIRTKIAMYGDAYIRKLRTTHKMRELFRSQGWKGEDNTEFVLGEQLYRPNDIVQAGFSATSRGFLSPFHAKGSLDTWRTLTSVLAEPGLEAHAFMLLLAFACPLIKLSGRQGFTVAALGDSGIGKSTMARFMSSVYSHPDLAWAKREDTKLARLQRLGAHASLPVYMDEATTIPNKDLRDLIYEVPTGKGRDSMRRDYTLREASEWSTILVTSTNDSLQAKLHIEKANAEAESLRLFEFRFPARPEFGPVSKIIPGVLDANYGVAGPVYVENLVRQRATIKQRLGDVVAETERAFGMSDKERFWSQAVAFTLYGGELARQWGLIEFDPESIRPWLLRETQHMRGALDDNMVSSIAVLGQYLDAHVGERLVITAMNAGMVAQNTRPNRELSQRYERDSKLLFISRSHIRKWLEQRHFNYGDVKDDLIARGVLIDPNARKVLGQGTDYTGGQVAAWVIKADHPDMGAFL